MPRVLIRINIYVCIGRAWIRTQLIPFAESNPDLTIRTVLKRNEHPFLRGTYQVGTNKTIGIKNLSPEDIEGYVYDLRNQVGRKVMTCYIITFHVYDAYLC